MLFDGALQSLAMIKSPDPERGSAMPFIEDVLSDLKRESFINAVRLFADACLLYQHRRHPSAYAFAVLAYEEIGKALSVDRLCDAMILNEEYADDILEGRLSSGMLTDHVHKQQMARGDTALAVDVIDAPPVGKFIQSGGLETTKQQALYVDLEDDRVGTPMRITREKALGLLTEVLRALRECDHAAFSGFDGDDTPLIRAQGAEQLRIAEAAFAQAQHQVRASSERRRLTVRY